MANTIGHDEIHLRDYLYILRKRRNVVLSVFLLFATASFVFTYFERVIYRATSTIMIERENPNVVDFKEVMAFDASTTDFYQTQYRILESRSLIEKLIQEEKLEEDPFLKVIKKGGRKVKLRRYLPDWLKGFITPPSLVDFFIHHMLQIEPERNSRLVKVSVLHPNPEQAARLANRLISLFVQRNLEERFTITKRAMDLLSEQLVELKEKVVEAERNLQTYKEKFGLSNIPSIREKDQFIQDAKLELVKIQAEEAKLAKRYLPAHPKRIHIRSQVEGLQEKIAEEEKKNLELSRIAVEYSQLEREAETAKKIYEALLSRLEETQSEAQTQASNILVVDRAEVPKKPYKPRPFLNFMVSIFLGFISGILLAFFVEYLDPSVKIPDDVEKALGLELFGIIPSADRNRKGPAKGELFFQAGISSPVAESFRALRTALLFKLRHFAGCRSILVTSPNPSEGKSTVALNLAAAFRQNGLKVLLIDADLRRPKLHRLFELPPEKGLTDILEGRNQAHEVIHADVVGLGFDFMSCGSFSDRPTEILGFEQTKELMNVLRQSYDLIIFDCPPYHAVADVVVLSEYVDGIVIVARYHQTHKRHLHDVKRHFGDIGSKVLGTVINYVSVREKDYYFHQYYYYGYGDGGRKR